MEPLGETNAHLDLPEVLLRGAAAAERLAFLLQHDLTFTLLAGAHAADSLVQSMNPLLIVPPLQRLNNGLNIITHEGSTLFIGAYGEFRSAVIEIARKIIDALTEGVKYLFINEPTYKFFMITLSMSYPR